MSGSAVAESWDLVPLVQKLSFSSESHMCGITLSFLDSIFSAVRKKVRKDIQYDVRAFEAKARRFRFGRNPDPACAFRYIDFELLKLFLFLWWHTTPAH